MVKACLFDLDGVVFDTEPLYTLFWRNLDKKLRPNIDNFGSSGISSDTAVMQCIES